MSLRLVDSLGYLLRRDAATRFSRQDCSDGIGYTSSLTGLNFCRSARSGASSGFPCAMASTTASPTIWCASPRTVRLSPPDNPPARWRWRPACCAASAQRGRFYANAVATPEPYANGRARYPGVEKPLFIFLHVFVVGQRQSFNVIIMPVSTACAAAFATDKLQGVRVFFCGISEEPEVTRSSSTKFASPG